MRDCHVSDATAVVRFLAWIETQSRAGVTELEASAQLLEYRREEEGFVGPSFTTIMGSGSNGAIIHYNPESQDPKVIQPDDMLLCDSGGHYLNGTTDITRTIHMGQPSEHQIRCYTRVLQGHVDLARAVIAPGITGHVSFLFHSFFRFSSCFELSKWIFWLACLCFRKASIICMVRVMEWERC
jgi:Xaa-Pro aminopeptidase